VNVSTPTATSPTKKSANMARAPRGSYVKTTRLVPAGTTTARSM
jgi:hypothetical protein